VSAELDALIHEAADWLRIPSISAGARNEAALREAATWAQRRVLAAGGTCDLVDAPGGALLVVGELPAARDGFGLPQDDFHAPDESFAIAGLDRGRRAARALYEDLGAGLARGA
jgi:hypothetical protein